MSKILSLLAALASHSIASPLAPYLSVSIVRRRISTTISGEASLPQGNVFIHHQHVKGIG
jgi:hypothetical protein